MTLNFFFKLGQERHSDILPIFENMKNLTIMKPEMRGRIKFLRPDLNFSARVTLMGIPTLKFNNLVLCQIE